MEHFTYLANIITNAARCTREIKSRLALAKAAFNKKKKKTLFTSKLDLNLRRKLVRYNIGAYVCMVLKIGHFRK
jgi:ABC-type uncharacterized transport system YnjBCD permease subunit